MTYRNICLWGVSLAALVAWSTPSVAQTADESAQLEEIVVTARKRVETLESAPLSVSAVGGERMAQQGVSNLEQVSASLPNVQIGRSPQTASINIRGIGSGANRGFEQSVGMYIDGVYMARSRQFLQPMVDLERVEVLRGPQGTLFGKNTVAGAVNVLTAAPTPGGELHWDATGDYEPEFDTVRATGALGFSPTDTLGVRLAGRWETTDGYVENLHRGKHEPAENVGFVRAGVAWAPTDDLTVIARLSYTDRDTEGSNRVIRVFNPALGTGLAINSRVAAIATPLANPAFGPSDGGAVGRWSSFTGNLAESPNDVDHQKIVNGSVNASWDLGWATLTSVSGYTSLKYDLTQDVDFLPVNLVQNRETEDFAQVSQELRLSFEARGPFSGILGAYVEDQDLDTGATTKVDGTLGGLASRLAPTPTLFAAVIPGVGLTMLPAIGRASTFDQASRTYAVFGELTWAVTEDLRVDLGLRWSHDRKSAHKAVGLFGSNPEQLAVLPSGASTGALTAPQAGLLRSIMATSFATFPHDQQLSRTEEHLTPAVNVQYDLPTGGMAYASWSRGFKSGGFNFSPDTATATGAPGPGTEFEDETVEAWEAGFKGRFFDNRARGSIAVFRADFEDLQVTSFRGTQFVVGNAGSVRSQGVETEGEAALADWITVGGAISYLDSHYRSFPGAPCTIQQLATRGPTCTQDLSGRTTPFAPHWSGTFRIDHTRPIGSSLIGKVHFDANYKGAMYLDGDLDPNVRQGGYTKLNARLAVGAENGRWEAAVFARNLTNEATYTFSVDAPLGAGAFVASIEEPRVIGLQLRFRN